MSDHVQEIRDLIETGDVSLEERRNIFQNIAGRATTLDDEALIQVIAATDDDDDELFVKNVIAEEQG